MTSILARLRIVPLAAVAACGTSTLDLGQAPDAGVTPPGDDGGTSPPPDSGAPTPPKTFAEQARELGQRWTWLDVPNPHETMRTVAGTGLSDVFYAGTHGTVKHWDGVTWTTRVVDPKLTFVHAWSPAPGSVWLVGQEADLRSHLVRVSGTSATEDPSMAGVTIQAITGTGPSLAWALGARGEVREWRGSGWRVTRAPTGRWLRGIHGFSASDVWAVGDKGEIVHYDGATWDKPVAIDRGANPTDADFMYSGVWGAAPDDVWAIALRRTETTTPSGGKQTLPVFSHFDGRRWAVMEAPENVCGFETPYLGNTSAGWWSYGSLDMKPSDPFDRVGAFGPTIAGTGASLVVAQDWPTCAWRYDGTRWRAEPAQWNATEGGKLSGFFGYAFGGAPLSPIARLSSEAVLASGRRLDLSDASEPRDGENPRWKTMLAVERGGGGSSLAVDGVGNLWAADARVKQWTPAGWTPLDFSTRPNSFPYLLWGAGNSRHLVARSPGDVWAGFYLSRDGVKGLAHWNGAAWRSVDLGAAASSLTANRAYTWAATTEWQHYRLHRLRGESAEAPEASIELPWAADAWGGASPLVALLSESEAGDRVYFAFMRSTPDCTYEQQTCECVVGSWDAAGPPRQEWIVPRCGHSLEQVERLARLPDGTIAMVANAGVWVMGAAGVSRKIERSGTACRAGAHTVPMTELNVGCDLRDLAPAPGGRVWLAAGGAILLWDPTTNELAEAVESVGVRTLVSGRRGEVFGAAFGASGYSGSSDTIRFIPEGDAPPR